MNKTYFKGIQGVGEVWPFSLAITLEPSTRLVKQGDFGDEIKANKELLPTMW